MTCPPRTRLGGERLYTLLRPTACQGGEGHAVARGGLPKARRKPIAESQKPIANSRQPAAGSRKPGAGSRQPEAGSLHYALAHPCPRVGGERLYTLLRPTACQGGEGHAVARGDCRRHAGSQQPTAVSRQPSADSRQRITHTSSYSNSDTLHLRFPIHHSLFSRYQRMVFLMPSANFVSGSHPSSL